MHAAKLETSPRLRRALTVLEGRRGEWIGTRTLIREARICAVNSVIAELRVNGCVIECEQRKHGKERRWVYRLTASPSDRGQA